MSNILWAVKVNHIVSSEQTLKKLILFITKNSLIIHIFLEKNLFKQYYIIYFFNYDATSTFYIFHTFLMYVYIVHFLI